MDGALRILLVEDDLKQVNLLENSLRNFNSRFEIDSIYSPDTALQKLTDNNYEAVIFDMEPGQSERMQILSALVENRSKVPVVVLSDDGIPMPPELEKVVHDHVVKNSSLLSELPKVIQRTIESQRLKGKLESSAIQHEEIQNLIFKSKQRLQSMFDGIQDTIYEVNRDFEIVLANKRFAAYCKERPENLIGKKCYEVYFKSDLPCTECPAVNTFENSESNHVERRDGKRILEMSSFPIVDEDGKVASAAVHSKDVTDKKMMEKSLIQSEKLATIGLLASGIAHELRNPLNIIETARYYISEFLPSENPDVEEKLQIIKKNVKRSSQIINDLLEFSRHSDGQVEAVDLEALIHSTVSLIGKELDAKNIELNIQGSNQAAVYFNVDSLKQVFLNLIINAIQAMPDGGKLDVTIDKGNNFTKIKVTDTGVGIPTENIPNLFSPFFTTKVVGEGTGLGLYISHIIIDREGGKIDVSSRVGKGTTFTVTLPNSRKMVESEGVLPVL